jgi:hypothetical protein
LVKFLLDRLTAAGASGSAADLKRWLGPFTSLCSGSRILKGDGCDDLLAALRSRVDRLPAGLGSIL